MKEAVNHHMFLCSYRYPSLVTMVQPVGTSLAYDYSFRSVSFSSLTGFASFTHFPLVTRRSREGGAPTDRDRVAGRGPPVCDAYW